MKWIFNFFSFRILCLSIVYFTTLSCHETRNKQQNKVSEISDSSAIEKYTDYNISKEDSILVENYFLFIKNKPLENYNEIVANTALYFQGTPYVAGTLEVNDKEKLVINLRAFDCTTYVETCLALSRCAFQRNFSINEFALQLKNIRYRNGNIDGYLSRLHYYSDWIDNNVKKGILTNETSHAKGVVYDKKINFISKHLNLYKGIGEDHKDELIHIEENLNVVSHYYIPKNNFRFSLPFIFTGDVFALTSNINGLDISHTGFFVRKDKKLLFIHASSTHKKVILCETSFEDYINSLSKVSGIMLARPIFR